MYRSAVSLNRTHQSCQPLSEGGIAWTKREVTSTALAGQLTPAKVKDQLMIWFKYIFSETQITNDMFVLIKGVDVHCQTWQNEL